MKNESKQQEIDFGLSTLETKEEILAAWAFVNMSDNPLPRAEIEKRKEDILQAASLFGLELEPEHVERNAKLFEAGEYPDKGVSISETDLAAIAAVTGKNLPLPIRLEHIKGPISFGALGKVWAKGKELFGRLVFPKPAWELVRTCGAGKLSIALRRDGGGISEISMVTAPRVADAAVFSRFGEELQLELGTERVDSPHSQADSVFSAKIEELERALREKSAKDTLHRLKAAGKIVPASEEYAKALLLIDEKTAVKFSGSEMEASPAELFIQFLECQPKVVEFSELARVSVEKPSTFSEDDERLFRKLGITGDQVIARNNL